MSEKIVHLNEQLVRGSIEETLNVLLEREAESLTQAARYERNETVRDTTAVIATANSLQPLEM